MTLPPTSEAIKPSEGSPDRQFYSKDGALNPDHRGIALHRAREVHFANVEPQLPEIRHERR